MSSESRPARRGALRRRLNEVHAELATLHKEIAGLGPGEALPGLYLLMQVGDQLAALPSPLVVEIVRLVEMSPLPDAVPHVLGAFLYRGQPAVAVDVARLLGHPDHVPSLDAHMVVVEAGRPLALVVDRVRSLVEAPRMAEPAGEGAGPAHRLTSALCRIDQQLVPVLRLEPFLEGLPA